MLQRESAVYETLKKLNMPYERFEHPAAMTMEDLAEIDALTGALHCKNLFLCNKSGYFLLLIGADKKFRTAEVSPQVPTARLSFGGDEKLMELLGLEGGAISPMGLINDKGRQVRLLIDDELKAGRVLVHPNVNTASIAIDFADLYEKFLPYTGARAAVRAHNCAFMTYDAMLVLGALLQEDGSPRKILRTRLDAALEAYRAGLAKTVILCGGDNPAGYNEALAMRGYLLQRGMDDGDILLERRSRTTRANLQYALPMLSALGANSVLVVTTDHHAPRTRYTARQRGLSADVRGAAPPRDLKSLKMLLRECAAMGVTLYRYPMRKGKLSPGKYYREVELMGRDENPLHTQVFRGNLAAFEGQKGASVKYLASGDGLAMREIYLVRGGRCDLPAPHGEGCCYVVRGGARINASQGEIELFAGDSVLIPPGRALRAVCTCKDALLVVCGQFGEPPGISR